MSSTARVLHQLLEADRLIGVEAAPRARFPKPDAAAPPAPPRPVPASRPAFVPAPASRPAALPPRAAMSLAPASAASAAWQAVLEAPLGRTPPASESVRLDALFISVEWGPPLTGEVRALFDRQVAAMKLAPDAVGLLRLAWPAGTEPDPAALAEAKARLQAAIAAHRPRAAVLLGGFSAKAATGAASLLLARGRWFDLGSPEHPCAACATWHPAQLGVDRDRRMQTWEDLQKVMAKLAE